MKDSLFLKVGGILTCVFLGVTVIIDGYKQEAFLYEGVNTDFSNGYIFRQSVPNASSYNFSAVQTVCSTGLWAWYSKENYEDLVTFTESSEEKCYNQTMKKIRSFRRLGPSDVSESAMNLTLFSGYGFQGEQLDVSGRAYAGITIDVRSLVWSANGGNLWEVYEGFNFNGRSTCLPSTDYYNNIRAFVNASAVGLKNIGSAILGCDSPGDFLNNEID